MSALTAMMAMVVIEGKISCSSLDSRVAWIVDSEIEVIKMRIKYSEGQEAINLPSRQVVTRDAFVAGSRCSESAPVLTSVHNRRLFVPDWSR